MARAPPVSCPGCAVYVGPTCQSALPCNHIPSLFFETHTSTTLKMEPPSAHVCSALLCSPLPRSRCSNHRLRRATTAASPCSRSSTPLCSASPRRAAPRPRPLAAQSPSSCLQPLLAGQARLPPRLPADAVEPSISGDLFVSGEFAPFSVLLHFHFFPHRVVCLCSRVSSRAAPLPDGCVLALPPCSPRLPCSASPRALARLAHGVRAAMADCSSALARRPSLPATPTAGHLSMEWRVHLCWP